MTKLEELKERLYLKNASLVVGYSSGEIKEYYQDRIKDIKDILQKDETALVGASIADKVIGKLAGSLLVVSGVKEIYADILSEYAIPVLEQNNIKYEYKTKVQYIINKDHTGMCPMENKFKDENDIKKIYNEVMKSN